MDHRAGGQTLRPKSLPAILTVTLNPAIDLNLVVDRLPKGDLARASAVRRAAGGKGINVARVLAELGVAATAACVVGGEDGRVFLSLLSEAPFETVALWVEGATRTNVTIEEAGSGRRFKVNQPGPALNGKSWAALALALNQRFERRQWIALSGALPPGVPANAYTHLVRATHRSGARVALDCEGPALRLALAAKPELIKFNRSELAATFGLKLRSQKAVIDAMQRVIGFGVEYVIVSDGPQPCLATDGHTFWKVTPPQIETGGSPMGAGDSFLAGLLAGMIEEKDFEECLRMAAACGAACASVPDTVLARRPPRQAVAPIHHR